MSTPLDIVAAERAPTECDLASLLAGGMVNYGDICDPPVAGMLRALADEMELLAVAAAADEKQAAWSEPHTLARVLSSLSRRARAISYVQERGDGGPPTDDATARMLDSIAGLQQRIRDLETALEAAKAKRGRR